MFLIFASVLAFSKEKQIRLDNFLSFPRILVNGDFLYAWTSAFPRFFIYSISKECLLKNLVKKGEGPGELRFPTESIERVYVSKNRLYIHSNKKMMVFTLSGKFLFEKRFLINLIRPVKCGDRFVGISYTVEKRQELYALLNLYDSEFNLIKTIYKQRKYNPMKFIEFMPAEIYFTCYENKIYVADNNRDLNILKYSLNGEKQGQIRIRYKRYEITEKDKKNLIKRYINKHNECKPLFHKYYPSFQNIIFFRNNIFIELYKSSKQGKKEFIVYNMDTKGVRRIFLPFCINYTFYEKRFYCVKIGEADEFYLKSGNLEQTFDKKKY